MMELNMLNSTNNISILDSVKNKIITVKIDQEDEVWCELWPDTRESGSVGEDRTPPSRGLREMEKNVEGVLARGHNPHQWGTDNNDEVYI